MQGIFSATAAALLLSQPSAAVSTAHSQRLTPSKGPVPIGADPLLPFRGPDPVLDLPYVFGPLGSVVERKPNIDRKLNDIPNPGAESGTDSLLNRSLLVQLDISSTQIPGITIDAAYLDVDRSDSSSISINMDTNQGSMSGTLSKAGKLENVTTTAGLSNTIYAPMSDGTTLEISTVDNVENTLYIASKAANGTIITAHNLYGSDMVPISAVEADDPSVIFLSGYLDDDYNTYCEGTCWRVLRINLATPVVDRHATVSSGELNNMILSKTQSGTILISGMGSKDSFFWEIDTNTTTIDCKTTGDYFFAPTYEELDDLSRVAVGYYANDGGLYALNFNGASVNWVTQMNAFYFDLGRQDEEDPRYRPRIVQMNNSDLILAANLHGGPDGNEPLGIGFARLNGSTGEPIWQSKLFQNQWMSDLALTDTGFMIAGESFLANFDENGFIPACSGVSRANLSIVSMNTSTFSLENRSEPDQFLLGSTFYSLSEPYSSYFEHLAQASIETVTPKNLTKVNGSLSVECDATDFVETTMPPATTVPESTTTTTTTRRYPVFNYTDFSHLDDNNAPDFIGLSPPNDEAYFSKIIPNNDNQSFSFYLSGGLGGWGGRLNTNGAVSHGITDFGSSTNPCRLSDGRSVELQSGYIGTHSDYDARLVTRDPNGTITDTLNFHNFSMFAPSIAAASSDSVLINAHVLSRWCYSCQATISVNISDASINFAKVFKNSVHLSSASATAEGTYLVSRNVDGYANTHFWEVDKYGTSIESLTVEDEKSSVLAIDYQQFRAGTRFIATKQSDGSEINFVIGKWGNGSSWSKKIRNIEYHYSSISYYTPTFVQMDDGSVTFLFSQNGLDTNDNTVVQISAVNFDLDTGNENWQNTIHRPGKNYFADAIPFRGGVQITGVNYNENYDYYPFFQWLNASGYTPGCPAIQPAGLEIENTTLTLVNRTFPDHFDVDVNITREPLAQETPTSFKQLQGCGELNFTGVPAEPLEGLDSTQPTTFAPTQQTSPPATTAFLPTSTPKSTTHSHQVSGSDPQTTSPNGNSTRANQVIGTSSPSPTNAQPSQSLTTLPLQTSESAGTPSDPANSSLASQLDVTHVFTSQTVMPVTHVPVEPVTHPANTTPSQVQPEESHSFSLSDALASTASPTNEQVCNRNDIIRLIRESQLSQEELGLILDVLNEYLDDEADSDKANNEDSGDGSTLTSASMARLSLAAGFASLAAILFTN